MATGRKPSEIIQCMIDEGYVEMDDEAVAECLRLVAMLGFAEFVTKAEETLPENRNPLD